MIINASIKNGYSVIPESGDLWNSYCPISLETFDFKNGVMRPKVLSSYDGLMIMGDMVIDALPPFPVPATKYYDDSSELFSSLDLVYDLNNRNFVPIGTASFYGKLDFSDKTQTKSTAIPQIGALVVFGVTQYIIDSFSGTFKPSANQVGSSGYGYFVGNVRLEIFAGV